MSPGIREDERLVDLAKLGRLVHQHKWPMLLAAAVVVALALLAFFLAERVYEANAVVALERTQDEIVRTKDDEGKQITVDSPSVDTEVQVLQSAGIVQSAVANAKLNTNPQVLAVLSSAGPLTVEAAARAISSDLEVSRQGLSYAIRVGYASPDPAVAALVANAVTDAYVNGQVRNQQQGRDRNIGLLRERLNQLRNDVMTAEAAVARYRADTNLVDIANKNTFAQESLSTLNTQLAQARAELAVAGGQARANAGGSGSIVNAASTVGALRVDAARLAAKQAELAKRYGPLHPDRLRAEAELAATNSALARETGRTASGVGRDVSVAQGRVAAIQGAIAESRGQLLAGNNASVRLNELERIAESARQLYQTFLDRYRVELATQGTESSRSYIIARAAVPARPASPDPLVYLLGGLVAGLAAAGLTAWVLEWRERGFRTRGEVEQALDLPVIASVPDLATVKGAGYRGGGSLELADYLVANDGSQFSEGFRSIRAALKVGQPGQLARTVAITSPLPDEGKTTTAICLARSSAVAGNRTLLIDCDTRRHASSRVLANAPKTGLVDLLEGRAKLEEVLLRDDKSGAFVLPQGPSSAAAYDIVQSDEMERLLGTLRDQFDLIVLDAGPVIPIAESRVVAAMADKTVLVVRWRKTAASSAKTAVEQLRRAGASVLGTVLGQVDMRATSMLGDDVVYYQDYGTPALA